MARTISAYRLSRYIGANNRSRASWVCTRSGVGWVCRFSMERDGTVARRLIHSQANWKPQLIPGRGERGGGHSFRIESLRERSLAESRARSSPMDYCGSTRP
jgi:hypothetical protein